MRYCLRPCAPAAVVRNVDELMEGLYHQWPPRPQWIWPRPEHIGGRTPGSFSTSVTACIVCGDGKFIPEPRPLSSGPSGRLSRLDQIAICEQSQVKAATAGSDFGLQGRHCNRTPLSLIRALRPMLCIECSIVVSARPLDALICFGSPATFKFLHFHVARGSVIWAGRILRVHSHGRMRNQPFYLFKAQG
jgi:hypothetical protein